MINNLDDNVNEKELLEIINGVENDEIEEIQPFDPEKISIDTKTITMEACLRRLEQKTIILNPDFQRNEVWTDDKKSRLIESLILKIPLPMFYVSADENNIFYVVDGLQRLSTIRDFILGKNYLENNKANLKGQGFKLSNLEFWGKNFNDKIFNDLPIHIYNRILETEFTFTVINPGTPEDVKRNIFKRINTGGEPLTQQEIRHALYTGPSTIFLQTLSHSKEFLSATDNSVKSSRMMDRELILRALAFTIRDLNSYPKNNDMDTFLSDSMRIINVFNKNELTNQDVKFKLSINNEELIETNLDLIEQKFKISMRRAKDLFGEHAFRKSYPGKRRTPINKGLFEVWCTLLSNINQKQFDLLKKNKKQFMNEYSELLNDYNFIFVISRDSQKYISVKSRYDRLNNLLLKFIND
ncbi:DUF262 domain-containing protein (plasmid) [Chryseobacterium panacisoli]|uniref:DUF262 domain-containing protein n=1 Tax=Chryseobacterium panacisoli TaxID=1807141 RepID=A0A5D9A0P7_9FLAO|nr:DUF262 domain-containing protein [Chryseobacterium panacisoli]TZF99264.1 DUF262 domain-containing protein [Chryseobacterium panacisoli]